MKNKKIFLFLLFCISVLTCFVKANNVMGALDLSQGAASSVMTETVQDDDMDILVTLKNVATAAIDDTMSAHMDDFKVENLKTPVLEFESYALVQLWLGHLADEFVKMNKELQKGGVQALTSYTGPNHMTLPEKLTNTISSQKTFLKDIIVDSMEQMESTLNQSECEELASLMAGEIIAFSIINFQKSMKGPSAIKIAAHHGNKGLTSSSNELKKLKAELVLLCAAQKNTIKLLKTRKSNTTTSKQADLDADIKKYKEYLDGIKKAKLLITLKIYSIDTMQWLTTSKWSKPLRFLGKQALNAGYLISKPFIA